MEAFHDHHCQWQLANWPQMRKPWSLLDTLNDTFPWQSLSMKACLGMSHTVLLWSSLKITRPWAGNKLDIQFGLFIKQHHFIDVYPGVVQQAEQEILKPNACELDLYKLLLAFTTLETCNIDCRQECIQNLKSIVFMYYRRKTIS